MFAVLYGLLMMLIDGFSMTMISAIGEFIDNALDARYEPTGKVKICFKLDRKTKTLRIVDPERGMNKQKLEKSVHLLDREKNEVVNHQGKYHAGFAAGTLYFNKGQYITTTLTKENDGKLLEMELDWPSAMDKKEFITYAHKASVEAKTEWDQNAIDPEHGTVFIIPCADERYTELEKAIYNGTILESLGKTFAHEISKGLEIEFVDDNYVLKIAAIDVLGYESAPDNTKQTVDIEIYQDQSTGEYSTFIVNIDSINMTIKNPLEKKLTLKLPELNAELEKLNMSLAGTKIQKEERLNEARRVEYENLKALQFKFSGKKTILIKCDIPSHLSLVGKATVRTVVPLNKSDQDQPGGIYSARYKKLVGKRYSKLFPKGGDHHRVSARDNARTLFEYGADLDQPAKTEANKSRHEFLHMDKNLRDTIEEIHYTFGLKVCDEHHPVSIENKIKKAAKKAAKQSEAEAEAETETETEAEEDDEIILDDTTSIVLIPIAEQEDKRKSLSLCKLSKIFPNKNKEALEKIYAFSLTV